MHWFLKFIFEIKFYTFRTFPLSIIRSFSLFTHQHTHRFADSSQAVSKPVWHIPLLCVHWKTPDDGQRNCSKHVEFYSKNKFEKLLHLVGFIMRIWQEVYASVFKVVQEEGNPQMVSSWNAWGWKHQASPWHWHLYANPDGVMLRKTNACRFRCV